MIHLTRVVDPIGYDETTVGAMQMIAKDRAFGYMNSTLVQCGAPCRGVAS